MVRLLFLVLFIIRPHCLHAVLYRRLQEMRPAVTNFARSVSVFVCLGELYKTAELIEMPFGGEWLTRVGQRNHVY